MLSELQLTSLVTAEHKNKSTANVKYNYKLLQETDIGVTITSGVLAVRKIISR